MSIMNLDTPTIARFSKSWQISMEMFYQDMRSARIDVSARQMRFKIDHPLCHYEKDYAHDNPSHFVIIDFSSRHDVNNANRLVNTLELES